VSADVELYIAEFYCRSNKTERAGLTAEVLPIPYGRTGYLYHSLLVSYTSFNVFSYTRAVFVIFMD